MQRKLKTSVIALLASLMLLSGVGLPTESAFATHDTSKQIRVKCTNTVGGWIRIFGFNQYHYQVNGEFEVSSTYANTTNWYWAENQQVTIQYRPEATGSYTTLGQYPLTGGFLSSWWDTIRVTC